MTNIRQAEQADIDAICALDHVAHVEDARRRFIHDSVRGGTAFVASVEREVVGYAVLEHSFFSRGFIAMLYVHPDHRRRGIGSALVHKVEGLCQSDRIFTSTNESNLPMQALLVRLGYSPSGVVNNLDPGDPELFYSKELRKPTTGRTVSPEGARLNGD